MKHQQDHHHPYRSHISNKKHDTRSSSSSNSTNHHDNNKNLLYLFLKGIGMMVLCFFGIGLFISYWYLPYPSSSILNQTIYQYQYHPPLQMRRKIQQPLENVHPDVSNHEINDTTTMSAEAHQEQEQQPLRIAMILPYISGNQIQSQKSQKQHSQKQPLLLSKNSILPPYMLSFCTGAVGAMELIDFFIFYIDNNTNDDNDNNDNDNNNQEENDPNNNPTSKNHTTTNHQHDIDHDDNHNLGWSDLKRKCPSNVKFIHLGDHPLYLAQLLLRVVDHKYHKEGENDTSTTTTGKEEQQDQPYMSYKELLSFVASYIAINPYGLVEFKPAFGHIFQDYLTYDYYYQKNRNNNKNDQFNNNNNENMMISYSHWGYTDLDIIFGDIKRWVTIDELTLYDIVTYTFGDQERLYLRGQFTIHKNRPSSINQLWRDCIYLSNMDERFYSIIHPNSNNTSSSKFHHKKYHVESAEGCYSSIIFQHYNISVKYAVKAWTDLERTDTAYTHGIYLSNRYTHSHNRSGKYIQGSNNNPNNTIINNKQILFKFKPSVQDDNNNNDENQFNYHDTFVQLSDSTSTMYSVYDNNSIPLQQQMGTLQEINIQTQLDTKKGCMYWVLPEYQTNLCLLKGTVTSKETIYWINGILYKQFYENTMDIQLEFVQITTGPFFHFQEWKRMYRYGQLATVYPKNQYHHYYYNDHDDNNNDQKTIITTTVFTPDGAIPLISNNNNIMDHRNVTPTTTTNKNQRFIGKLKNGIIKKVSNLVNTNNHMGKNNSTSTIGSTNWGSSSPLGLHDMTKWHGVLQNDRSQLPGHVYCLVSVEAISSSGKHITKCSETITWQDNDRIQIISGGSYWKEYSTHRALSKSSKLMNETMDVSLVLTLIMDPPKEDHAYSHFMLENVLETIRRWQGQPCVVIIYVDGPPLAETVRYLEDMFSTTTIDDESMNILLGATLIAVVYNNDDDNDDAKEDITVDEQQDNNNRPSDMDQQEDLKLDSLQQQQDLSSSRKTENTKHHRKRRKQTIVSRKALLNMAIDAVPTRWYVSGIELERGLTISMDTAHFVHQVATSSSSSSSSHGGGGSVYWIPQFQLVDDVDTTDLESRRKNTIRKTNVTIHDMIEARKSTHTILQNLNSHEAQILDCSDASAEYDDERMQNKKRNKLLENLDTLWWYNTEKIVNNSSYHNEKDEEDHKAFISSIQQSILELSLPENYNLVGNLDTSPILLLDNHGPYGGGGGGIRTNEMVREIEEFVGENCYNVLKMTQLAILGYKWDMLDGAFAISLSSSSSSSSGGLSTDNKLHAVSSNERCPKCSITKDSLLKSIYNSEIRRVAQTAILWNEYYNPL